MNILQISPQIPVPPTDGGKLSIYGSTKYLSQRGHSVDFVVYRKDSDYKKSYDALKQFCNPVILDVQTNNSILDAFTNLFSNVPYNISKFHKTELRKKVEELLSKKKYDIVHIDNLHMAWIVDVIKQQTDIPVVLREQNLEMRIMKRFAENQGNPILKKYAGMQYKKLLAYEPAMCEKFDRCIMITNEDSEELLSYNKHIRTSVIPAGIDERLLGIKKKNPDEKSIFHIGSYEWFPNVDGLNWFLKKIFQNVINKIPDLKFYIYGKGIENVSVPDSVKSHVFKIGYVENLWEDLSNKSLAIVPLRIGGGMRIKIIELLGAGHNILSTSIGSEGIKVKDNEELLIADSEDDFCDKIIRFFNNEYDNERLSNNAREAIRKNYTWNSIAEKFENVYLEIIGKYKN